MTKAKLKAALAQSRLFGGCDFSPEDITLHAFSRSERVTDECGGVCCAGIVVSGRVEVYSVSPDGGEVNLSVLGVGDCFGISNLFGGAPLETRLSCLVRSEVAFIPKARLISLIGSDDALRQRYMALLNQKISFLIRRIEKLTTQSSRAKLADYLLTRSDSQNTVWLDRSKERLAKGLGISRAALFREFKYFAANGLISYDSSRVTLLSPEKIELLLSQKTADERKM